MYVVGKDKGVPKRRWSLSFSPGTSDGSLNNTSINLTAQAGKDAFLPCRVGHLGDTQVILY